MNAAPAPEGTNTNSASGLASRTFCRNGAKSGLRSGTRSLSATCAAVQREAVLEEFLGVDAGAVVADQRDDLLILFFGAHSAMLTAACGSVKLVRTMNGEASVIAEVAAAITTIGVFDWVAIGAVASASRRDAEAGEHHDLVVDHQLLRQAARRVGHGGVVLHDDLDLLARRPSRRFAPCRA